MGRSSIAARDKFHRPDIKQSSNRIPSAAIAGTFSEHRSGAALCLLTAGPTPRGGTGHWQHTCTGAPRLSRHRVTPEYSVIIISLPSAPILAGSTGPSGSPTGGPAGDGGGRRVGRGGQTPRQAARLPGKLPGGSLEEAEGVLHLSRAELTDETGTTRRRSAAQPLSRTTAGPRTQKSIPSKPLQVIRSVLDYTAIAGTEETSCIAASKSTN